MNRSLANILRIVAVLLLALTAAPNLLGVVGTVCAAFFTARFPAVASQLEYAWLYQILMIAALALGALGVWLTVALARNAKRAMRRSLRVLVIGTLLAAIHVAASLALRGKAVPANIRLHANAVSLFYFLILQIPSLRRALESDSSGGDSPAPAAGLAAVVAGATVLTTPRWVGASHTYAGQHRVLVYEAPLLAIGIGLSLAGVVLLARWAARPRTCPAVQTT